MALLRSRRKILRPGVLLDVPKDVPLYHADPEQPSLIVRILNGKKRRGKLVDGKFKAA